MQKEEETEDEGWKRKNGKINRASNELNIPFTNTWSYFSTSKPSKLVELMLLSERPLQYFFVCVSKFK